MTTATDDAPALERVEISGVTTPRRSAIATAKTSRGIPAIFVHGIFENLWKWLTLGEAAGHAIAIDDHRFSAPRFSFDEQDGLPIQISRPMNGSGVLSRLWSEEMPAVAYSYQDLVDPIADMANAVECLHKVAKFAMDRWNSASVQLVGHSRGGLVCRHALIRDSAAMTATDFRQRVHRLTTVAAPHAGSRVAEGVDAMDRAIARFENFRTAVFAALPTLANAMSTHPWEPLSRIRQIVANTASLTPTSEEVRVAATENMPVLEGGYNAVAGTSTVYFRCDVPLLRSFRFPPAFPIPELTDGQGDIAVAIPSALDIPNPTAANTAQFDVNHFTNTYDTRIHDTLVRWLK